MYTANNERHAYMIKQDAAASATHVIDWSNIFVKVCRLFESSEAIKEYPLRISFLNEKGFDTGGLLHDMLSHFWQVTLPLYFEGNNQVVPVKSMPKPTWHNSLHWER